MPQASIFTYLRPIHLESANIPSTKQIAVDTKSTGSPIPHTANDESSSKRDVADITILDQIHVANEGLKKHEVFVPLSCPTATVTKIQPSHLLQIKQITSTLLPVRYPDRFFDECLRDPVLTDVCRVVLIDSKPVGWIRSRLDPTTDGSHELYIQALGILAPWRGIGLAHALLQQVAHPTIIQRHNIALVSAHVWEDNKDALEWYEKQGFNRIRFESHYYRRLKPAGAWVVHMRVP